MTPLSLYNASIPGLDRIMGNLLHILKTGEAHAAEHGLDPQDYLQARLAPDMFTLIGQVQVATSLAKACPFRITGQEPPVYDDDQASFDDLYARIAQTRSDINRFTPDQINGLEAREFSVKLGPKMRDFTAISYLSGFIIPNVYFHITTSYNILRFKGVPLGKGDYFGGVS